MKKLGGGNKLFLYGAGDRALAVYNFLKKYDIEPDCVVIARKYYKEKLKLGYSNIPVYCMEDMVSKFSKIILVLGLPKYLLQENFSNVETIKEIIDLNIGTTSDYNFKYEYVKENYKEFDKLYHLLDDEKSKSLLTAHINGRIIGKSISVERMPWIDPSYFFSEFMSPAMAPWKECENIVDCGAYIGDTYEEFLRAYDKNRVKYYKYYCIEPNFKNIQYLKEHYIKDDNLVLLQKGVWNEKASMHFSGENEAGAISETGDIIIEADSIDNMVHEPITYIKMDVEGAELMALKGAKNHILNDKPRLGICLYHKKEDLITIPQYIYSLRQDYKYIVRPHSAMPTELVLYCF